MKGLWFSCLPLESRLSVIVVPFSVPQSRPWDHGSNDLERVLGKSRSFLSPSSSHHLPWPFSRHTFPNSNNFDIMSSKVAGGCLSRSLGKLQIWVPSPLNTYSRW